MRFNRFESIFLFLLLFVKSFGILFVSIIYLFFKEYEDFDEWIEEIVYLVLYQVIFNKTLDSNNKEPFTCVITI